MVEKNFWALNSIVVEPAYAAAREILRHFAERLFAKHAGEAARARLRAVSAAVAGVIVSGLALLVLWWVWPSAHLFGRASEVASWRDLVPVALANSVVLVAGYFAVAALVWGFADATMAEPRSLKDFHTGKTKGRKWRIVHLSDIHLVAERYGFRVESGRSGPRGNERVRRLFAQLEAIDAKAPLDTILITGDMTDAGISTEWVRVLRHPRPPSAPCRARADHSGQSRPQHHRPRQSGAHGFADVTRPALAPDPDPVRHEHRPRLARSAPSISTTDAWARPWKQSLAAACRRRSSASPMSRGRYSQPHSRTYGPSPSPWWCRPTATTVSASSS